MKQRPARRAVHARADGYVRTIDDRFEKDPDEHVRAVIELIFASFAAFSSARRVFFWLCSKASMCP